MPIAFTHPAYLLLVLPVAAVVWWASRGSLAGLPAGRHLTAVAVRAVLLLCVIGALAGAQSVRRNRELAVFFLVDVSDSVPRAGVESALAYIREATTHMRASDRAGVIVFGRTAAVEHELSPRLTLDTIHSQVDTGHTDAAAAVRLALASIPPGVTARLVLFSDGNETTGSLEEQIQLARAQGVVLDVLPRERRGAAEATAEKLIVPTEVKVGEPFTVQAIVTATQAMPAMVHLLRDDRPIESRQFLLTPGKNTLSFHQVVEDTGFHEYELLIEPAADLVAENNRGLAFTRVRGRPQVLHVEGKPGQERYLRQALAAQEIDVEFRTIHGIPTTAEDLQRYDAFILSDVMATAMAPEQMRLIETAVRETGLGFGMVGGDASFGAGGYYRTPIEEALPVSMDVRQERVFPSLAVVLAIDASGSMGMVTGGATKIAMAGEAAAATLELLRAQDFLGIYVDGVTHQVLTEIHPATDTAVLTKAIRSLVSGGGGFFYTPSLKICLEMFRTVNARQKHLIVLADGADVDKLGGEVEVTRQLVAEGVTISTVAFGEGLDVPFLAEMARIGGGQAYLATNPTDLPRIFTRDTLVMGRSVLVEEPFNPVVDPADEILRGVPWETAPPLYGYVATSPKDLATIPMVTHRDDPLLARWNYGLGRSIAFTSDVKARWARDWLRWPAFGPFWAQTIRWTLRKVSAARYQSHIEVREGTAELTVDALDEAGEFINNVSATAIVALPDGSEHRVPLRQVAPGRYTAALPAWQVGTYLVTITDDTEGTASYSTGFSLPYPAEYARLTPDRPLLERAAALGNGTVNPEPAVVFNLPPTARPLLTDLWPLLLFLALLLVPVDIAVRRLAIGWPQVVAVAVAARAAAGRALARLRRPAAAPQPTLQHLRAAKERVATRDETRTRPLPVAPPSAASDTPEPAPSPPSEEPSVAHLLERKRRRRSEHPRTPR